MCDLKRKSRRKEITGWKVVAVHNETGEYYSSAMGFKYSKRNARVPNNTVQKSLCRSWHDGILDPLRLNGYRKDMTGRTSIFLRKRDAVRFVFKIMEYSACIKGYQHKIVKAIVSDNLMDGIYEILSFRTPTIAAGRRIRFLE